MGGEVRRGVKEWGESPGVLLREGCRMGDSLGALVKNTKRRFQLDSKQDSSDRFLQ